MQTVLIATVFGLDWSKTLLPSITMLDLYYFTITFFGLCSVVTEPHTKFSNHLH